jgi:diguanylate cyclase (GGDEF)-like protein
MDADPSGTASSTPNVIEPTQSQAGVEPQERRLRHSWWLFAGSFFVLGLLVLLRLATDPSPVDLALVGLVVVVGFAAVNHRNAVHELEVGRRAEAESLARILQGLSRSISPDAIVAAIVEELGVGTDADHIVVVRRRPDAAGLEATLVSSRPGVPSSTTLFPLSDLDDPLTVEGGAGEREPVAVPIGEEQLAFDLAPVAMAAAPAASTSAIGGSPVPLAVRDRVGWLARSPRATTEADDDRAGPISRARATSAADRIAERLAARARTSYGLRNTLAEPLRTQDGVIGAIVLSRRVVDPWPASTRRILAGAAVEASAALARATHHHDAETRASTDALTGLPNRRYFDEFCGLLARRRRADDAVGVLLVDIDWFKSVNDTWGHAVGDEVLRAVSGAIAGAVRDGDVPARFGGEEFAVLLRNPGLQVAIDVGERIRAAVGRLDLRRFGPAGVTVSVGVAVSRAADQPIAELVTAADRALYEAKRQGRDRVVAAG